ncbi:DcaP family trimeric outer membrane transporter [Flavihumibacter rivuli]|uniref:DcaP family trimeric outer membrane transporter n=1 Tax=Flavihumibacter rivuli TaxID=2838156 RepID=UPI001BDE6DCB|nr:DcaP family trimeric outer membrane transporter [Flavihumibacter rivuli]ULQ55802.1 DcaP family trimeric outer membrane transporter [Flavihumibacter rivuli]
MKKLGLALVFCLSGFVQVFGQTEFDSLKRNSMLDTMYQPSNKPTIRTEFAELKISGFVQPAFYFDYNNVLSSDLFITSEIPTTGQTDIKFNRVHFSANQSRMGFAFKFPTAGKNTTAFIEADFFSSAKGANSNFRLRHAYLTYGEFLIGQSWTNFGDVSNSPNTLDLEGPNSMPASRVAQVRWKRQYTKKFSLLLAAEEPRADYTPLDSAQSVKAAFPEVVVKPAMNFKQGKWISSVIYKPIVYTDKDYSFKKRIRAWGVTSSLTLNIPDQPKAILKGIRKKVVNVFVILGNGTQGAVNDFGGLGFEALPSDSVTLKSLMYYGGYVSFSFVFKKRWSSTYVMSYLHQEKPEGVEDFFKKSNYLSANAIYAINKYFTAGGEFLFGSRENYDNTKGRAFRVMALMRLIF